MLLIMDNCGLDKHGETKDLQSTTPTIVARNECSVWTVALMHAQFATSAYEPMTIQEQELQLKQN